STLFVHGFTLRIKSTTDMKSSFRQNLLIACSSVIVLLLIMECILRILGYGNVETYLPDQDLLWRLAPNQETFTKIGNKPVTINSHGMRDREYTVQKPDGIFRILVIGNSCTYGWGVYQDSTYSKVLEQLLNRNHAAQQYEVMNAGVIGYSISQILEFLKADGNLWSPDLVLVSHTFNEGKRVSPSSPQEVKDKVFFAMKVKNILRNIALYHFVVEFNFSSQYVKLARKITEDPSWIDSTAFNQYEHDLRDIVLWSKTNRTQLAYLLTVTKNQIMADSIHYSKHQLAILEVGRTESIPVVDFMKPFRSAGSIELYVDGGHPNEIGHRIMATAICKELFRSSLPNDD
ncbi:MAG: SGNH/GDSL hydrolase family protein, partial [Bacteroidetes bacterium]|nr:SGNH/GDSL hydrolase family protein [Bacteroidota bacterium]